MAKVVPFTYVRRKNIAHKEKPDLYYALAKASGDITISEMSERIQRSSTVNGADVVAVLHALEEEMTDSFKRGEIVRLGDLGSFQVTLRSSGVEEQKNVKDSLIKGAHICFRPGAGIRSVLKTLVYSKLKDANEEEKEPDKNPDESGDIDDPTA